MINIRQTDKLVFNLKLLQVDYNEQKKEALRHQIAEKYNVPLKNVEVNFVPITVKENGEKISLASNIINDIQDPKFQLQLFNEYIKLRGIKDIDFKDIETIDSEVNAYVDFDSYRKYKTYKFKYVKWDNYLSYGKDNYCDFTQLNGLVLLNGQPENQCGKTSFSIDLLRFALFGKSDKTPTLNDVFNKYLPEETEVMVEAGIEIDGLDYVIRRTITRPSLSKRTEKSKCKQKVEYFRLINGSYDLIDNCEGETVQQTNNIIKETVGGIEDYNLVISATAYTLADLLRMGQKDKSALFSRWLGLMTLEKKEEVAKSLWKDKFSKSLLSNTYNKGELNNEVQTFTNNIADNNAYIVKLQDNFKETNDKIEKLNNEKTNCLLSLKEIKESLLNVDITTVENKIKAKQNEIEAKRSEFSAQKELYEKIKDVSFDETVYKQKKSDVETLNKQIDTLKTSRAELGAEYKQLMSENNRIHSLISKGVCPTCNHPIDIEEQNGFISNNDTKIKTCTENGLKCKETIEKLTSDLERTKSLIVSMEEQRNMVNERDKLKLKLTAMHDKLELLKKELSEQEQIRKDIEDNKENIRKNNEINIKIRNVGITINNETNIRDRILREIEVKKNEIKTYEKHIDERKKLIDKLIEEEKLIRNWKLYIQLVGKDGITKIVLKKALPIINNEIKRLLNGICDFDVILSISDDNKVCINMKRDDQLLDLGVCASGFETTIASIALRTALCSISSISRPNFCVLDEVIGAIGVSNYENLHELLNRMCSNYQFVLHISHVEDVWDWHNTQITVYKDCNVSKIK